MNIGKNKPLYPRIAQLKTTEQFRTHLDLEGIDLGFDPLLITGAASPFASAHILRSGQKIGNAFCILPMEGWDGTIDGRPSELTLRRWSNFGISGAKLIWGCEAVAVSHDGRANPNQLLLNETNFQDFETLFQTVQNSHQEAFGRIDDLLIGLQLTHSGRFCKPNDKKKMEPQILYQHPVLNKKFDLGEDYPILSDEDIERIIEDYVQAAVLCQKAGFQFVDIKHCHGYLGHEFLSSYDRPGKYGGSFENRTRFLKEIVAGVRAAAPGLEIGVRLSVFDWMPFQKGPDEKGIPSVNHEYQFAFGGDKTGMQVDLEEIFELLHLLQELKIELLCTTAGSPYYNPHIQRPALFPPSDGYLPPEDPLHGVARQIQVTAQIKNAFPSFYIVGSAYSYLQDWLPQVAHHVLATGQADSIGLGRLVLSYPDFPADILANLPLKRGKICRTFSDCTTAPRNGIVSGCYPLDPFYKEMDEYKTFKQIKD